jgi:hypothetical protein
MKTSEYYNRLIDEELLFQLSASGAVLIEGAKWCGKTSTGEHCAKSVIYMQDPDRSEIYHSLALTKPSRLLEGAVPRLIDEWQDAPALWNAVRFTIDQRGECGQFILTGSAVPSDDEHRHTGTGRISRVKMRPMSLWESRESTGEVSLKDLFDGKSDIDGESKISIEDLEYIICRGGWPAAVTNANKKAALQTARNYVKQVVESDIQRVDGKEKNPTRAMQLLRSLSRNISTMATDKTILDDMAANDADMTIPTLASYLNAFRRIFLVEDTLAWNPSLRSKTAIRTSSKRQLVDPSIACATLRLTPERLLNDIFYFGFLFESLCSRDLRIYTESNDGSVFHYRDKSGLEADMILALNDGRWAAVEVKLGSVQEDEAAHNLIKLKERVNADKMGEPSFLMVLTGGQYAYRRQDGVYVVPIGTLKN